MCLFKPNGADTFSYKRIFIFKEEYLDTTVFFYLNSYKSS